MLIWIVEKWTKVGDVILDPMFGSGTAMLACTLGRHVIGVELERKFVDMAQANWEKVRQRPQLGCEMGTCQIIHGDARNLSGLLADSIISSPPYGSDERYGRTLTENSIGGREPRMNMVYGQADQIITSPPYGELANEKKNTKSNVSREERLKRAGHDSKDFMGGTARNASIEDGLRYSHDGNNIGNLPYGSIDHVITSPPYEGSVLGDREDNAVDKRKERLRDAGYSEDYINGRFTEGRVKHGNMGLKHYSNEDTNIGNLKTKSYLEAMGLVYRECFSVLKPGGLMILIVKSFIRDQKLVDLAADTIKLCGARGFLYQERWYRELPSQSFWRILYRRKYPSAPTIDYEDVLVFKKA